MNDDNRDKILELEQTVYSAAEHADRVSFESGFPHRNTQGEWTNVPAKFNRSIFEEALRMFLKSIGLEDTQVDDLTRKEQPAAASGNDKGGGRGKGHDKGARGKGHDKGGRGKGHDKGGRGKCVGYSQGGVYGKRGGYQGGGYGKGGRY